jgi:hypothetical protein
MLNLPGHHSTAAIVAEIENSEDWVAGKGKDGERPNRYNIVPEAVCKITDCDSAVNIEFDVETANQLENSLHKVDTMIEALLALREGMVVEHHRYCDRAEAARQVAADYDRPRPVKRSEIRP